MIGKDVAKAAKLIKQGELVAIPTETVYGLAANALNENAVKKIYHVKNRPIHNPLIIHLADVKQIDLYATHIPDSARLLLNRFSPGPITVILPKRDSISSLVTGNQNTVAIRIPAHPIALELLNLVGLPLAAPSANPSGYISPTSVSHILKNLSNKVSYILDGGQCSAGLESTIVGFDGDKPIIYREGVISAKEIELLIGKIDRRSGSKTIAPGMSIRHYSPTTPLLLCQNIDAEIKKHDGKHIGVITFNEYSHAVPREQQRILCVNNEYTVAAKSLYATMHQMDERGYDMIIARKFPQAGIGIAINDRLERAAIKV